MNRRVLNFLFFILFLILVLGFIWAYKNNSLSTFKNFLPTGSQIEAPKEEPLLELPENPGEIVIPDQPGETKDLKDKDPVVSEKNPEEEKLEEFPPDDEPPLPEAVPPSEGETPIEGEPVDLNVSREPIGELVDYGTFYDTELDGFSINKEDATPYATLSKEKESFLSLSFANEEGLYEALEVRKFPRTENEENLRYVLEKYTSYLGSPEAEIEIKTEILGTEKGEDVEDIETTNVEILVQDDNILMIAAEESVDLEFFVDKFYPEASEQETLENFLESNEALATQVIGEYESMKAQLQAYNDKVDVNAKDFGEVLWDAYNNLNVADLLEYYADSVWFFAGDEWEDALNVSIDEDAEFVQVDDVTLINGYSTVKFSEFKNAYSSEELAFLKKGLVFYEAQDLITACRNENKKDFYDYFDVEDGDILMMVVAGEELACTASGKFYGTERLWVLRKVGDTYRVFVDYTE